MKLKNILLWTLFGLIWFGAVYATLAPNIAGRPLMTSADPSTYFTIIQSGTTQGKISMEDFANSISGSFITTESDPLSLHLSGNTSGTAMSWDIWMWNTSEMFFADNYYLYWGLNFIEMYGWNGSNIQSYMWIDSNHKIYLRHQNLTLPIVSYGVMLWTWALEYNEDYASVFTDRSLIDKWYMHSIIWISTWYIPYWIWTWYLSSSIFYTWGKVGVGTNSPTHTLTVSGSIKITWSGNVYDSIWNPYITWLWYMWLTNYYLPYWNGSQLVDSVMYYRNSHMRIWVYGAWDTSMLNIRDMSWGVMRGLSITLANTGWLYDWAWIDIKAQVPIMTTTSNLWDPLNTTNMYNTSQDNWWYFIKNYVSDIWWFSSMISKWGIVGVANGSSYSTWSPAWFYIINDVNAINYTNGSWRIVMSWANLSIQTLAGWVWIEKWVFTP